MPSIIHLGAAAIERTTSAVCMPADAMSGAGGNRATNRPAIAVASSNDDAHERQADERLSEPVNRCWGRELCQASGLLPRIKATTGKRRKDAERHPVWLWCDIRIDKPLEASGRRRGQTRFIQHILPHSGRSVAYMGMTVAEAPHGAMNCN